MISRIDHMLGHKTSLNPFKTTEITSSIFSNHNDIKLKINCKKKTEKYTNTRRLNNMLLNNKCANNEVKDEIKRYLETMIMNTQQPKIYATQQKQF